MSEVAALNEVALYKSRGETLQPSCCKPTIVVTTRAVIDCVSQEMASHTMCEP